MNNLYRYVSLFGLLFLFLLSQEVFSQQAFQFNTSIEQQVHKQAATISGELQQRTYFELNDQIFQQNLPAEGDFLEFQLTQDSVSEFEITRISEHIPGIFSYIATDPADPWNTIAFTYSEGRVLGTYHKSDHSSYFIEYDNTTGQNYISDVSYQDDIKACGVHEELEIPGKALSMNKSTTAMHAHDVHVPTFEASQSLIDDHITIDLLIAYTEAAKDYSENQSDFGSIEGVIAQSLNIAQQAIDNSNLALEIRLVHFYETDYEDDESSVSASDHLRRFTRGPGNQVNYCQPNDQSCDEADWDGYMEEVHDLRNQYGADLVALYASEPNTGGIAWRLNSVSGRQDLGFSVNRIQQVAISETVIHELGHNMGLAHSRTQQSNAAGITGGLFEFSTGHQYNAGANTYATVMAYNDANTDGRVPVFSSPDIQFDGGTTGTDTRDNGGPSNSVKSLELIKRTIANYRMTQVDAPVSDISQSAITVNINREDETNEVITISNTGDSDYMWDVDFRFSDNSGMAKSNSTGQQAEVNSFDAEIEVSERPVQSMPFTGAVNNGDVVYSTEFGTEEGFELGSRDAIESWGIFVGGDLTIDDSNPSAGSNHLRMESLGGGNNIVVSPYFGPQSFSKYEVSFDIYIPDESASNNANYIVYLMDKSTPDFLDGALNYSAGLYFQQGGNLFARGMGTTDSGWFGSGSFQYGEYNTLRIVFNTDNETLDYYINDELRNQLDYIDIAGYKPDEIWFRHLNNSGARWDIDNVVVKRTATPTSWLSVDRFGGVVEPGNSSNLTLTFNTEGIDAGTYELNMILRGNDPNDPEYEIPITLEVNDAVSIAENQEDPVQTKLAQNYPNPFNPTTMIDYTLANSGQVTLSVYDMIGRRVATLVNEQVTAGEHQVQFDASSLSSGVYIYRLQTPYETLTRQMILIK